MKVLFIILLTLIFSGCATVFKGYMPEVEIKHSLNDSVSVFIRDGIKIPAPYRFSYSEKEVRNDEGYIVLSMFKQIDSTTQVINLRSNRDQLLVIKGKNSEEKYIAYKKIGAGWLVLDVVLGGFPAIIDAITENWNYFDDIQYMGE